MSELPAGWIVVLTGRGYQARLPAPRLHSLEFPTEAEAVVAAENLQAAFDEGLLGMSGRGVVDRPVLQPSLFDT
jgi:hypothetical protein